MSDVNDSDKSIKRTKRQDRISLKPLTFEEALRDLLNTEPPPEKTAKKKKPRKPKKSEE